MTGDTRPPLTSGPWAYRPCGCLPPGQWCAACQPTGDTRSVQDQEYVVANGWLAEVANEHTCGAGRGGYYGAHEPACGLVPVAQVSDLLAAQERVTAALALHPKIEGPRHGCCAPPKLCNGHPPECGSRSHGLDRPKWPCADVRALTGDPS